MPSFLKKIKNLFMPRESTKASSPIKDIFVGIFIGVIIAFSAAFGLFQKFEYLALDSMFRLRGERPANESIAIVEIDDRSLEALGRWPWPRDYHAMFLQIVNEFSPHSVVFDILFPEVDVGGDEALAAVAKERKNLYLASYFTLGGAAKTAAADIGQDALRPLPYITDNTYRDADFYSASEMTLPVKILMDAAKRVCAINAPPASDGATRRLPLVVEFKDRLYPTLGLQLVCDYLGVDAHDLAIRPGFIVVPLRDKEIRIPVDPRGMMLLNFTGPITTFKRYSYIHILHDYDKSLREGRKSILENLTGKIVFVGHTATGSVDLRITPFSNLYPAVGGHATAFGNILDRNMMREAPRPYNIAAVLLLSAFLSLLVRRGRKARVNLTIMAALFLAYLVLSFLLFAFLNLWVYTFAPLLTVLLAYVAISINQYEAVRHEKKILENELLIARTIQQSFLPKSYPKVPFLEFAARCSPAKQIGGDLYDFVQLGDDKIGVVIGDVSGKGVPAALYMARAVSEFRTRAHMSSDAPSTLDAVNNAFAKEGMEKSFITMQYLIVDLKERRFFFSNGGHNTILHFIKNPGKIEELDTKKGMPIGIIEGTEFDNQEIKFDRGDILFLYTDGISEAMDKKRREFGVDRVKDILAVNHELEAGGIMLKVLGEIAKFSKGAPQHDDMTIIVIKAV